MLSIGVFTYRKYWGTSFLMQLKPYLLPGVNCYHYPFFKLSHFLAPQSSALFFFISDAFFLSPHLLSIGTTTHTFFFWCTGYSVLAHWLTGLHVKSQKSPSNILELKWNHCVPFLLWISDVCKDIAIKKKWWHLKHKLKPFNLPFPHVFQDCAIIILHLTAHPYFGWYYQSMNMNSLLHRMLESSLSSE